MSKWSWDNFWTCPECANVISKAHEICPLCEQGKQLNSIGNIHKENKRHAIGKRDDLGGLFVRSSWEANYARYLNWLVDNGEISSWEYEPDKFEFEGVKGRNYSYTPDFKVYDFDKSYEYHEVKGYMDKNSQVKLKRFAKYYPDEKLILIDSDIYKSIAKKMKLIIDNWE